jgi:hypothetical protein
MALPHWTRARPFEEPRVDTALVINVAAREYPDFLSLDKIICAHWAADGFSFFLCLWP